MPKDNTIVEASKTVSVLPAPEGVYLHFKPAAIGPGAGLAMMYLLLVGGLVVGFFIALIVGLHVGMRENLGYGAGPGWLSFFVTWAACLSPAILLGIRSQDRQKRLGSPYSTIGLTRDALSFGSKTYARDQIRAVYVEHPDTSFTYKSSTEYELGKAVADNTAKTEIRVAIDYGADRVPITHRVLKPLQAEDISDLIVRWIDDPDSVLRMADESRV